MLDLYDFDFVIGSVHFAGGGGGKWDFGCGWIVIVIAAIALIFFIFNGAGWDAVEGLLTWSIIAFLFARSLFR